MCTGKLSGASFCNRVLIGGRQMSQSLDFICCCTADKWCHLATLSHTLPKHTKIGKNLSLPLTVVFPQAHPHVTFLPPSNPPPPSSLSLLPLVDLQPIAPLSPLVWYGTTPQVYPHVIFLPLLSPPSHFCLSVPLNLLLLSPPHIPLRSYPTVKG